MGITPQELRTILRKSNPSDTLPVSGGFVASAFSGRVTFPTYTGRQLRTIWNGRKLPKGQP